MFELSGEQRKTLRKQLRDAPPADGDIQLFLERYCYLESLLRTIGRYYRSRKRQVPDSGKHEALNINVVSRSLKYFGCVVSDQILEILLSSSLTKRTKRSARNLRNGIVHNWSKEDRQEVVDRSSALVASLDSIIHSIQLVANRI